MTISYKSVLLKYFESSSKLSSEILLIPSNSLSSESLNSNSELLYFERLRISSGLTVTSF